MIKLVRTNSKNLDFIRLVSQLDADLQDRDGDDHPFYAQFNTISKIRYVVVAYYNEQPVGCGAIREHQTSIMEIKRMYVAPESRNLGIATRILEELETWATELSATKCVLETGKKQPEAIALYRKNRYEVIPNFGPYKNVEDSVCFEKQLLL